MFWRYLPLAGILALLVVGGLVRPLVQYLRYGSPGIFLFRSGQNIRDGLFLLLLASYLAHGISGARRPRWVRLLIAEDGVLHSILQGVGATAIGAGFVLFAAAQLNLGASWRIGIDEGAKPGIVRGGLYRLSRHPIYLGILILLAGFTAMLPTPLSLFLLLAAYLGFRVQMRVEEDYMLRTYGEPYREYGRRVGRFLPWVGRM
jgi:protein-S-isoprenylcysteine O-methyltransferase Ste14